MNRFLASLQKELLLLFSDKTGLLLMFAMPLLLVMVITVIQDSVYKVVNENKIPLLVVNDDRGDEGRKLIETLRDAGIFEIHEDKNIRKEQLKEELIAKGKLIALYIPENLSSGIVSNATVVSKMMMKDMGLETDSIQATASPMPALSFYHDPVLQENYTLSVMNIIRSYMRGQEIGVVIDQLYADAEIGAKPDLLKEKMLTNNVTIKPVIAKRDGALANPNSTQHNVPAWTIFAMFFMVVSLGANIVKERLSGSFLRLKTMPGSFGLVLMSKVFVYMIVAILQVGLIFSVGVFILPLLGLPQLSIPFHHIPAFVIMVILISFSAVSYALTVGTYAKTVEQANGMGAISIVLFAAIGGIWVPTFMMPGYMKMISNFSPLHWCLEGFYILFLKDGSLAELKWVILFLSVFIVTCQLLTYFKLKSEKIV